MGNGQHSPREAAATLAEREPELAWGVVADLLYDSDLASPVGQLAGSEA